MTLPPSRNGGSLEKAADCLHGECMWFSQPDSNFTKNPATGRPDDPIARIPGEPTLDAKELRTYNIEISDGMLDYTRMSPWRAPGSAPVHGSGCGVGAGGPEREMDGGTAREFGLVQNMDGKSLPRLSGTPPAIWKRNSTVEVGWANNANREHRERLFAPACDAGVHISTCRLTQVRCFAQTAVATRTAFAKRTGTLQKSAFRLATWSLSERLRFCRRSLRVPRPASAMIPTTRQADCVESRPASQAATPLQPVGRSTPAPTASPT